MRRKMVKLFSTPELIAWPLPAELMSDVAEGAPIWDNAFNPELLQDIRKRVVEHVSVFVLLFLGKVFFSSSSPLSFGFLMFDAVLMMGAEYSSCQQVLQPDSQ